MSKPESIEFMRKMFGEYYKRLFIGEDIQSIDKREFGFASFERRILRHKGFRNIDSLLQFLRDFVPRDAYFSCAFYDDPEAEMEKKGWLGADLVFDIDADHIPTKCDKFHDEWSCVGCGFTGRGVTPEKCPSCGQTKFEESTWPCEVCLDSAKHETIKLLGMLTSDFGFLEKEIRVFFSGHRGYHVHVQGSSVQSLDASARKEIVDYVCGLGLDFDAHGIDVRNLKPSALDSGGWNRRIRNGIYNLLLNGSLEDYKNIGLKRNVVEAVMRSKNTVLKGEENMFFWKIKGIGSQTMGRILDYSIKSQAANVDTVVTTDVHRLIRIMDTLHGKTGFKKTEFPISAIDDFNPFLDAIAFNGGMVTVLVSSAPRFTLKGEVFGPFKNQKVDLPTAGALLLISKGRAEVA